MAAISLEDYINEFPILENNYKYLPLCHTTPEGAFASILNSKELKTTKCDKYVGEELLYLFYGKTAYLVDKNNLPNLNGGKPIALLYDFEEVKEHSIKRILPFDSGAFAHYKFPLGTNKDIFEIKNCKNGKGIAEIIQLIYGKNADYIYENPNQENLNSKSAHAWAIKELAKFYKQMKKEASLQVGKQALTLELQLDQSIRVSPKAIFFPFDLLTDSDETNYWTIEKIESFFPSVEVIIYNRPGDAETAMQDGMEIELALRIRVREKVKLYANI
jgi:hypothetical protein